MFALQKLSNKIPLLPFLNKREWSLKSEYAAAVFENDDNDNDVCCFVTIKCYHDCFCLLMAWHTMCKLTVSIFTKGNHENL